MFINPVEILDLTDSIEKDGIDFEIVKKAKRKLFADIDLSDNGVFEYYGIQLTKGNCEKVIDELNNNDYKEFYLYLANNRSLNEFLASGNEEIFKKFKQDSIYKLPEFVKFISPYFAPKFDKALLNAFENDDVDLTKAILNTSLLISQSDLNIAFKSVSYNIQSKIAEIDQITKAVKNEESNYDEHDIEEVIHIVKEYFPTNTLNCLPPYFQSQILKIANSINYLSNSIWDAFDTTQVPNDLTQYLLALNIGGLDRPIFENNFKIINRKHNERIEQVKNAPLLKKWANVLLQIRKFINNIESESLKANIVYDNLKNEFNISELNSLPEYADEIRKQIGLSIRSLSISMWNKQNDIISAIKTINLAMQINISYETQLKFANDEKELKTLERKYNGLLVCYFCEKNKPDNRSSLTKEIYKETSRSFIGRSVQFSHSSISIPRCKPCEQIHSKISAKVSKYSRVILILSTGIGIAVGLTREERNIVPASIFGVVVGVICGVILVNLVSNTIMGNECEKEGIKDISDSSLKRHPLLIDKIKEGWTFSKPSA